MTLPLVLAQAERTCARDQPICQWLLDRTGSDLVARIGGGVIPSALKIVLILVLAYTATRIVKRLIKRFVRGLDDRGLGRLANIRRRAPLADTAPADLTRAAMRAETIAGVLRSLATFAIWTVAVLMILGEFNINLGPLIAGAGIAGVALGFGAQSLVKDFLSGIFMLLEDQYGIGDIVDLGEASGTVEMISLRSTRIRDVYGTVWHIPNGQITRVGNLSQQWARALLDIGVSYDTDVDKAFEVIKRVADGLWRDPDWEGAIQEEPEIWGVENFSADAIVIRLVVKTTPKRQFNVNREIRRRLKEAFDAEGITIPFPQRTVWMHQVDGQQEARERNDLETVE